MRGAKRIVIVLAGVATVVSAAAHAQSDHTHLTQYTNGGSEFRQDSRVFGAMNSADHDRRRATDPVVIGTAELVRSRAAAEFQAEATPGRVREFAQTRAVVPVSVPVAPPTQVSGQVTGAAPKPRDSYAVARAQAEEDKARSAGAVFYYLEAPVDRTSGQRRPYITEKQRAAEHARYEANKRRGVAETAAIPASPPLRAQAAAPEIEAQSQSSIRWSDSGRMDDRNASAASAGDRFRVVSEHVTGNERASADARAREILSDLH